MTLRDVVLGGWISYVTSLCQSSDFEKAVESGRRAASLYTTIVGRQPRYVGSRSCS